MSALEQLSALANPAKTAEMAAYHKADRKYLGVSNPQIIDLVGSLRDAGDMSNWLSDAKELWDSDIHEARITAAKLLTKARIRDDQAVWEEVKRWVPMFDSWAIADHVCKAGEKRLVADPDRIGEIEEWTQDPNFWVKRAALVMTLPWAKLPNPKPAELATREVILGWAATYCDDREWFIQKSVSWWLRTLSKHDPERVRTFISDHGERMKTFARKDATQLL